MGRGRGWRRRGDPQEFLWLGDWGGRVAVAQLPAHITVLRLLLLLLLLRLRGGVGEWSDGRTTVALAVSWRAEGQRRGGGRTRCPTGVPSPVPMDCTAHRADAPAVRVPAVPGLSGLVMMGGWMWIDGVRSGGIGFRCPHVLELVFLSAQRTSSTTLHKSV